MNCEVEILSKESLNHDVIRFRLERPERYEFSAGQATELKIEKPVAKGPGPFTFTGLNTSPYLELSIKIYRERDGLTAALERLEVGDKVMITEAWDSYQNNGPGVFIAGGAGITPFIALLRQMEVDRSVDQSWLFFSNKTVNDIFLSDELKTMLGDHYVNVITRGQNGHSRHIDEAFFRNYVQNFEQPFYVCGPPGFMDSVQNTLKKIGASERLIHVSF